MTEQSLWWYRSMPPKEDLVLVYYRKANQLPLPTRASQTWIPGMQNQKGTFGHCIHLPEIQYICPYIHPGKAIHGEVRSQTTGNDTSEEPCRYPTQAPEDLSSATAIQCDHQIQTREGHAAH